MESVPFAFMTCNRYRQPVRGMTYPDRVKRGERVGSSSQTSPASGTAVRFWLLQSLAVSPAPIPFQERTTHSMDTLFQEHAVLIALICGAATAALRASR